MNLATVRTALTRNKRGLMIAGAAAVGTLALLARKKAGGDTPTAGAAASGSSTSPTSGSTSAGGYTTYPPYDSSGSDVYGAIQPQLEELRDMFGQIPTAVGEAVAGALPAPAPVPTPTTATAPSFADGFYRAAGNDAVFQASNGALDFLTYDEYLKLGAPQFSDVSKDDPRWAAPVRDPGMTIPWAHA